MNTVSIVIAILNSHEIVRRQIIHFHKMHLPPEVEILFIDDGSIPPLAEHFPHFFLKGIKIHATNDFRPWTQQIARNKGVKMASGEYVICTDIDHILTRELIDTVMSTTCDVVRFKRQAGVLDENGNLTQDVNELVRWGLPQARIDKKGLLLRPHGNSYGIRRELYLRLGGSREDKVTTYPSRDEVPMKRKIKKDPSITISEYSPTIYMFPNGFYCGYKDYNPFGMFHNLSRKQCVM